MPATSSEDKASLLVEDIIHEIQNSAPASAFHDVDTSGTTAILTLETVFRNKPPSDPPPRVATLKPVTALPRVQPRTKLKKNVHFPTPVVSKRFANPFSLPDKVLFRNPAIDSTNIIPSTAEKGTLRSNYTTGFGPALFAVLTTEATNTAQTNSHIQSNTLNGLGHQAHQCHAITHHATGKQLEYRNLIKDPFYKQT